MSYKLSFKSPSPGLIGLMVAATTIPLGIIIYGVSNFGQMGKTSVTESKPIVPIAEIVTALGRLEPETEVIKLSAPLALDGDRIVEVLVKEGANVKVGQVINPGEVIGLVGTTGQPDIIEPHLHFEVRYKLPVGWVAQDPEIHLKVKPPAP